MRHRTDADVTDVADEDDPPVPTPCMCSVRLLEELRPAYAEVIRRVDMEGEDAGDVARALGISTGNLHVRLHRARRALRDDVRHYCDVTSHRPCLDCTCDGHLRCGRTAEAGRGPNEPSHPNG
jgi:RNA polymerase sigma-70 factor (ECF subfamily)